MNALEVRSVAQRRAIRRKVAAWWTVISIVTILVGFIVSNSEETSGGIGMAGPTVMLIGVACLMFPWSAVIAIRLGRSTGAVLIQTAPSPMQIQEALRVELGREARLEEVAAVPQMLTTERNQEVLAAGALLAAAYLVETNRHLPPRF